MKIIEQLLRLTFPTINVDQLMEVIGATKSPETAVEILCGLYEEPQIPKMINYPNRGVCKFISYDKWESKVSYSYHRPDTKNAYFPKGTLKEDINMSNFDELKDKNGNYNTHESITINTGTFTETKDSMSLGSWLGYPVYIDNNH